MVTIEQVKMGCPHLNTVKALGRENRKTLGLFPDGAFDDYAERGTILAALEVGTGCIGYLLYRVSREAVYIVHLCVGSTHRRCGIASRLARRLIEVTRQYRGIGLKCRPEYDASHLWPRLGFVSQGSVAGRSADGKPLTFWWRENDHAKSLFSNSARAEPSRLCGVMDANVFFDITDTTDARPQGDESRALLEDWIQEFIQLCLTDEIFNEIHRAPEGIRKESEKRAREFMRMECPSTEFDCLSAELLPLFPGDLTDRMASDHRELTRAIACGAAYLLTRDGYLLNLFERIQEKYGLQILTPLELILRLDEVQRANEYQPIRFSGSQIRIRRLAEDDLPLALQFKQPQEPKGDFRNRICALLSAPHDYDSHVITYPDGMPIGLLIMQTKSAGTLDVPILRVCRRPIGATLYRQLVRHCLVKAQATTHNRLSITDYPTEDYAKTALEELGFADMGDTCEKVELRGILTGAEIRDELKAQADGYDDGMHEWADEFINPRNLADPEWCLWNEHYLWPCKISDGTAPSSRTGLRPFLTKAWRTNRCSGEINDLL